MTRTPVTCNESGAVREDCVPLVVVNGQLFFGCSLMVTVLVPPSATVVVVVVGAVVVVAHPQPLDNVGAGDDPATSDQLEGTSFSLLPT